MSTKPSTRPASMRKRPRPRTIYDTRAWRACRAFVLSRDGYRCQIGGPKCRGVATEADHIVPVRLGGAPYDLNNLRAACKSCNAGRFVTELVAQRSGLRFFDISANDFRGFADLFRVKRGRGTRHCINISGSRDNHGFFRYGLTKNLFNGILRSIFTGNVVYKNASRKMLVMGAR